MHEPTPETLPWTPRCLRAPTPDDVRAYLRGPIRRERPTLVAAMRQDARQFAALRGERFEFKTRWGHWVNALRLMWVADAFPGVVLYRLQTCLHQARVPIAPRLLHRICIVFYGIDIDNEVAIGPGLYLPHGKVCVAGVTVIGQNATIAPWTTIGLDQGSMLGPVIGDAVFVGTGAKVLGPVRVGESAIIAASAVVVSDVAAGTTVGGVPARQLRPTE